MTCLVSNIQGLFADMNPLYYLYRFSGQPTTNENMATYPNCCYKTEAAKLAMSTQVGEWANLVMHEGMELPDGFTGSIDKDFIRGMIPHHQGAVVKGSRVFMACSRLLSNL